MENQNPQEPHGLIHELKRRKVLYAAGVYGVTAFAVTEIAAFLFENFSAPLWASRLLAALFVAGFPVAMYLSWVFDFGVDSVERTSNASPGQLRKTVIIAGLLLVTATGGLFYLIFPRPESGAPEAASTVAAAQEEQEAVEAPLPKLENSIAVLPFESFSTESNDAMFGGGMAEEILSHLSHHPSLNIIGRTSSFAFSDSSLPVPEITALLGVRFLLQGSVRRHESQLRVSTQLLDKDGVQVWSQVFDRQDTDIFAIQTEIAQDVARAVVPRIAPQQPKTLATSLDAYEKYLEGRTLLFERDQFQAAERLQESIALDPEFAPAHAELAIALAIINQGRITEARTSMETALALQPDLNRARAARGLILTSQRPPDPETAITVLQNVLAREPNMSDAVLWLSSALSLAGRESEAEEWLMRGVRMDPLHPTLTREAAGILIKRGVDRRAEAIAQRVIESPKNRSFHPYVALFRMYMARGRLTDMALIARQYQTAHDSQSIIADNCYCVLGWTADVFGDRAQSEFWLQRSKTDFGENYWYQIFQRISLQFQGRYPEALDFLNEQFKRNGWSELYGPAEFRMIMGTLQSLVGEHERAINTLGSLSDSVDMTETEEGMGARQALAWSQQHTGKALQATENLALLEQEFRALEGLGELPFAINDVHFYYALNAAIAGDRKLALERLESIIRWGWRGYYQHHHDPRWGSLSEDAAFQDLMQSVKTDVDRQRAELAAMETQEAFIARLEAVREAYPITDE